VSTRAETNTSDLLRIKDLQESGKVRFRDWVGKARTAGKRRLGAQFCGLYTSNCTRMLNRRPRGVKMRNFAH